MGQVELHSELQTGPIRHELAFGYEFNAFTGVSDRGDTGGVEPTRVGFAYPVDDAPPVGGLQRSSMDHYRHVTHSAYGFDHLHLLDGLIAIGGLRFDALQSRVLREFVDRESGDEIADPETGRRRRPLRDSASAFTGQLGLTYSPWSPLTLYGAYSNSFKPVFIYPSDPRS